MSITLTVNGVKHTVDTYPSTPLLYILRNDLDLHGPKFGCGLGQCGACTVIVNGVATRSCVTAAGTVRGEVTTLEGLSKDGRLDPVQRAWIEEQVPQCGYCQSGMIIAAADLLQRIPNPTVAQIKDAFTNAPPSAHLCRCGTYQGIVAAVQRAAKLMNA